MVGNMDFIISASTDIGIKKNTNQDSLSVKTISTSQGKMVFAVLCDGMGGLSKGELASATVIKAFDEWAEKELPRLCSSGINEKTIKSSWETIILRQNEKIMNYGLRNGVKLGTTVVIMLITETKYYVLNVGDSRAYEIDSELKQLTKDQTFIAREIECGRMTPEEARVSPQRNVLLQCVGASNIVSPDMFYGVTKADTVYMLCSDGFRHEISADEIYKSFAPDKMTDAKIMKKNTDSLIELNKSRLEPDNISVITIRT